MCIFLIIIFILFYAFMHIIRKYLKPDIPSVRKPMKSTKFNEVNKNAPNKLQCIVVTIVRLNRIILSV